MRHRRLGLAVVACSALAAVAPAQETRTLRGSTQAGSPMELRLDAAGRVVDGAIPWRTRRCQRRRSTFRGTTTLVPPFDVSTPRRLVVHDRIVSAKGRFVSTIRFSVRGRAVAAGRWRGTISARVIVRRDGRRYARCRRPPLRWEAEELG